MSYSHYLKAARQATTARVCSDTSSHFIGDKNFYTGSRTKSGHQKHFYKPSPSVFMPKPKQHYYKRKYQPKQMKSCNIRSVYGFAETFLADIYSGDVLKLKEWDTSHQTLTNSTSSRTKPPHVINMRRYWFKSKCCKQNLLWGDVTLLYMFPLQRLCSAVTGFSVWSAFNRLIILKMTHWTQIKSKPDRQFSSFLHKLKSRVPERDRAPR